MNIKDARKRYMIALRQIKSLKERMRKHPLDCFEIEIEAIKDLKMQFLVGKKIDAWVAYNLARKECGV